MAAPLSSLADVAAEVRDCLAAGARHDAFRVICDWYGRARRADVDAAHAAILVAPGATGHREWDAMLAGLTEQLCLLRELRCPRWAFAPERFLATWWFLSPYASVHPSAFVEAPTALANRGVFIHAADFDSV